MVQQGLVIIGGGGHAAVVAEAAALGSPAIGLAGFLDDSDRAVVAEWAAAFCAQGYDIKGFTRLGGLESLGAASTAESDRIALGMLE